MPPMRMAAAWCVACLAGCTLTPEAAKHEREELERIGAPHVILAAHFDPSPGESVKAGIAQDFAETKEKWSI